MKFSIRQIIASATGAVVAATIASLFGVNGTIIGVAIGSAVATFGTAFISQSIERGHEAVKQVAVRAPDRTALLRRLGGTSTSGAAEPATVESSALTEETASAATVPTPPVDATAVMATEPPADDPTVTMWAPGLPHEPPATDEVTMPTAPVHALEESEADSTPRGIPWKAISATAAIVFVLSLGTVTVIELIAGHPLSDLFNHNKSNAPTIGQLVNPPAATTTTTSTSTTSTSTTTTTSTSTTTTSTSVPGGSTTTTAPTQGTTTTSTTGGTTTSIP